jgi:hypothetical protein
MSQARAGTIRIVGCKTPMPRRPKVPVLFAFPPEPDPAKLPRYGDRRQLADIHSFYFGPQSPRSLERWPLEWRIVNGRAVAEVRAFIAEAQRRFDAAPVIRGGRRMSEAYRQTL